MTLKDILEDGYGIDFSTLDFKTREDSGTKEEILKSIETNELLLNRIGKSTMEITDFDIEDSETRTTLYLD